MSMPYPYPIITASGGTRALTVAADTDPMRPIERMADLAVFVAGKPISANAMYGTRRPGVTRGGRHYGSRYLTDEADAWEHSVARTVQGELNRRRPPQQWRARPAFQAPIRVRCTFFNVRADADNLLKCTLDGLKAALDVDDYAFSPVEAVRKRDKAQPQGALVEVWAAGRQPRPAPAMSEADLVEALADKEHASWARWMAYLFSKCARRDYGLVIPQSFVEHWQREIDTAYADLPERTKQSDRDEVAHILPIIRAYAAAQHGGN